MMKKENRCFSDGSVHSGKKTRGSLLKSFAFAFMGIRDTIISERNMKIHVAVAAAVVTAGFLFHISSSEWIACLTQFGIVMSLELVNTAVESAVDLETETVNPLARKAKDAAAGAVLIASLMAALVGLIIFIPKL